MPAAMPAFALPTCGHGDMWRGSMTTQTQDEFIQQHEGVLTPEQAAQLLDMAQGDTGAAPETGSEPAASTDSAQAPGDESTGTTAPVDQPKPAEKPDDALDASNAAVLARDGKHLIDYQKLVDARDSAKHWKEQAEAAQQELQRLQSEATQRANAGEAPTQIDTQLAQAQAAIDAGADISLFGDFSEEAIAKGIQALVGQHVQAALQKVDEALAPVQAKQTQDAAQAHYGAIYAKHPDADSIAESKELDAWISAQPSFVRDGYRSVLDNGTPAQVIELFDSFKQAAGLTQAAAVPQPKPEEVLEAAKAKVKAVVPSVPATLSDFPGGVAGAASPDEVLAELTGPALIEALGNKTPEQIERFLNRSL